jgi:hypothetical protein
MPDTPPPLFSPEWFAALKRMANRAIDAAERIAADPTIRADLATLWIRGASAVSAPTPPPEPKPAAPTSQPMVGRAGPTIARPSEPLPPLTGPRQRSADWGETPVETGGPGGFNGSAPFDPQRVAPRCRMKAQAARWQSERERLLSEGEHVADQDQALVGRAREAGILLWMVSPMRWAERSEPAFAAVAGCYDALADAAELVAAAEASGQAQEEAILLLAEAQSAVKAAMSRYSTLTRDDDQQATFLWLREQTYVRRIMTPFLRSDHLASPESHEDIRARVRRARDGIEAATGRSRATEQLLRKLRFHVAKIAERPPESDDPHDAAQIAQIVEKLVADRVPPTDVRLREILTPILDLLPEDVPPVMERVLDAINDHLDQSTDDTDAAAKADSDDADALVQSARDRVAGRNAVLIGGRPSEPHRKRLEAGLGLQSLNWVHLEHHESFDAAAAAIRRPEVGLVMVMTRWRSHRDGPAARALCKKLDVPLVELPGGYNLRQAAHQIVRQIQPTSAAPA